MNRCRLFISLISLFLISCLPQNLLDNSNNSLTSNSSYNYSINQSIYSTENLITITFESNGGSQIATLIGYYGESVPPPLQPYKEGFNFFGWYSDEELTKPNNVPLTFPSESLKLYAKWHPIIINLDSGDYHSGVLTYNGELITWGRNNKGQLGNGSTNNTHQPQNILPKNNISTDDKVIEIELGGNHSSALTSYGRVFMWGSNENGQLGDNTTINRIVPREITASFSLVENDKIIKVELGTNHSSALSSKGRVFMWGSNENGQLGVNSTINRSSPIEITSSFPLDENDKILQICMGERHSSALTSHGRVFMWGSNENGQLGENTTINRIVPREITASFSLVENDKIIKVELGANHSSALSSNGRVFMWGLNEKGQLGDGTTINRTVPTDITSSFSLFEGDKIITSALGAYHSSTVSLTGRVFMFGNNLSGQIGDGTTISSSSPIEITSKINLFEENDRVIAISLGSLHSLVLLESGYILGWGYNDSGQIGRDSKISFYVDEPYYIFLN